MKHNAGKDSGREPAILVEGLSDILASFRESFQRSGLTEEEFDQLIEEELQAGAKRNVKGANMLSNA